MNRPVALITGASSGIGAALAKQLNAKGFALILAGRNPDTLEQTKRNCLFPDRIQTISFDALHFDHIYSFAESAISRFGYIDWLINNAGISQRATVEETQPDVLRSLMEIDFFAPALLTKALLPHLKTRPAARIAVINSMSGLFGFPQRSGYSAAKHALKGFFETLQLEEHKSTLSVTLVYPGRINTPISLAAVKGDGSKHGEMDPGQEKGIPVDRCAQRIISAIEKKRKRILIVRSERLLWFFHRFYFPLFYFIASRIKPN